MKLDLLLSTVVYLKLIMYFLLKCLFSIVYEKQKYILTHCFILFVMINCLQPIEHSISSFLIIFDLGREHMRKEKCFLLECHQMHLIVLFSITIESVLKRFTFSLIRGLLIYLIALIFVEIPKICQKMITLGKDSNKAERQKWVGASMNFKHDWKKIWNDCYNFQIFLLKDIHRNKQWEWDKLSMLKMETKPIEKFFKSFS